MVKDSKKHQHHRKRDRMTVQAFCSCPSPDQCIAACAGDMDNLFVNTQSAADLMHFNAMFGI